MARAIWSGSISFGLLNVPVKLYSAVSKQTVRFRELREADGARDPPQAGRRDGRQGGPLREDRQGLRVSRPTSTCSLTKDELAELDAEEDPRDRDPGLRRPRRDRPDLLRQPYYLGPDKGAEKAYALLVQAMEEPRKVAIARFVLPQQGAPGGDPADGRRADADDDALRRRGGLARGPRRRALRARSRRSREARARDGRSS